MTYIAQWERLSDAATRVATAAGVSKEKAQSDICQGIADGTVNIRCKLKKHTTRYMTSKAVLQGADFDIPTKIGLQDLDWEVASGKTMDRPTREIFRTRIMGAGVD